MCSLAASLRREKVVAVTRSRWRPRTAPSVPGADREALLAEVVVARTADLVLKAIGLAERYERAEPSQAGAARVLVLRTTAAQGCALILTAAESDGTPRSWVPCP